MDHQYINQLLVDKPPERLGWPPKLVVPVEATIKPTSNTTEPLKEWRLENHYLLIPRSHQTNGMGDYDSDKYS